jgi:hypothetical protein
MFRIPFTDRIGVAVMSWTCIYEGVLSSNFAWGIGGTDRGFCGPSQSIQSNSGIVSRVGHDASSQILSNSSSYRWTLRNPGNDNIVK